MGKFSELRNFRNGVILEVNRDQRPNLAEIEKRFLVAGRKEEESVCEINGPGDNVHDRVNENENEISKEVEDIEGERKVKKYKTIKKKLTEVFALLQRPKRKPLREFFIDEEEELESKYLTYIHNQFSTCTVDAFTLHPILGLLSNIVLVRVPVRVSVLLSVTIPLSKRGSLLNRPCTFYLFTVPTPDPNAPKPEGSTITPTVGEQLIVSIVIVVLDPA